MLRCSQDPGHIHGSVMQLTFSMDHCFKVPLCHHSSCLVAVHYVEVYASNYVLLSEIHAWTNDADTR